MERILELRTAYSILLKIDKEYEKIASAFEKSYNSNNVCISAIFRIENLVLENNFWKQYEEIKAKRKCEPKIMEVFHGTRRESAKNIMLEGFDPKYNVTYAFGKGTYCSPQVITALGYCKDANKENDSMVFLCDMMLGNYGPHGNFGIIDTEKYDYSGNNSNIYVTPYRYGIIPKYLICYYGYDK